MSLDNIAENKHDELLALLNPLIDFMNSNGYNYFLVAGKDGICSRYMRGQHNEVAGILTGFMESNKGVMSLLKDSVYDYYHANVEPDSKKS